MSLSACGAPSTVDTGAHHLCQRRGQQRDPAPVIALTANALKEDLAKSLAAGCVAHLTKPIKKQTLIAAIAQYAKVSSDLAA